MSLLVDTVLNEPCIRPGTMVPGRVHLVSGARPVDVEHVTVSVETCGVTFVRHQVASRFSVPAGRSRAIPFLLPLPWETPVTRPVSAVSVGLRTEVSTVGEGYACGPDSVAVRPLLGHQRVLDAIQRLGFQLAGAALSERRLPGVRRSVPFFQEFTFRAAECDRKALSVAFVANPVGVDVVLTADDDRHQFSVRHRGEPHDPTVVIGDFLTGRRRPAMAAKPSYQLVSPARRILADAAASSPDAIRRHDRQPNVLHVATKSTIDHGRQT